MPYAVRDGVKIYWTESGHGDPLLLIMGLGATHDWWNRFMPAAAQRYRTIAFDNRGSGESDAPPGPYTIPDMAADAAAVLDAAGVGAAHVFGASLGGMIAQEFALRYPERVRSLVLGCTAPGGRDAVPARKEVRTALGARATVTREEASRMMVPYIYDPSTPRARVEEDLAMRLATTVPNEGFFAQLAGIREWPGSLSRLGSIRAPVLVIHGESDELIPPENSRIIANAIPHAKLVMLPRASHIFLTDQLESASDAIFSFMASC